MTPGTVVVVTWTGVDIVVTRINMVGTGVDMVVTGIIVVTGIEIIATRIVTVGRSCCRGPGFGAPNRAYVTIQRCSRIRWFGLPRIDVIMEG